MNDDTIGRQAAIEIADILFKPFTEYSSGMVDFANIAYNHALADFVATLNALPSAERRGRWIENEFGAYCSNCGLYAYRSQGIPWKSNYCPICGSFNGEGGENEKLQR